MHLTLRSVPGKAIAGLLMNCTISERKAAITLARSQYLPNPEIDTVLFSKCRPFLKYLVVNPSLVDDPQYNLTELGEVIIRCITTPILAGYIISLALGQDYTEEQIQEERKASFNKELAATLTRRAQPGWNWDYILGLTNDSSQFYCHKDFPALSILHLRFRASLSRYRNRIRSSTVFPHYTRRGVSKETAYLLLQKYKDKPKYGTRRTFHRNLATENITSLDVIHHFIRSGDWIRGNVEMKQRWYPSFLSPRTYFSWGGIEIQASTYLRNFFNDVADQFEPTHRHLRVQPNWLKTDKPDDLFFFYDLTSFTSWFHEQVPFLRSLANYFTGVTFDLVSEGLTLHPVDVGAMIEGYIRWVNDFPQYSISERLVGRDCILSHIHLVHYTAGFLGVPGNLVMCTLPHGLAMATDISDIHHLQVPGDDVGKNVGDIFGLADSGMQAKTLGVLQMDKVYNSSEASVYLKRGVRIRRGQVDLTDMLIYPLLPLLVHPENANRLKYISEVYRLPDTSAIIPRACSVMVSFVRQLWKITAGNLSPLELELITDLLLSIHRELRLPLGGILQGRYVGSDDIDEDTVQSIPLKFPLEDRYFRSDPDVQFASDYVEVFTIRELDERQISGYVSGALQIGQVITVRAGRGWRFLEDMGYLRRLQRTAGITRTLVGMDAKVAYLNFHKPAYSTYIVDEEVTGSNLMALGLAEAYEGAEFSDVVLKNNARFADDFVVTAWRFRYVDLDKPKVEDEVDLDYGDEEGEFYHTYYPYSQERNSPVELDVSSYIDLFK